MWPGMIRGYLVNTARYALGFVVSISAAGSLGACGGRYELGETGGKGGSGGGKGGTSGSGGTAVLGKAGNGGSPAAGTAGDGVGGTTGGGVGGTAGDGVGGTGNVGGEASGIVSQINTRTNKLDLLLMVDNSNSMAAKQAHLTDAIYYLIRRLTMPECVDATGKQLGTFSDELGVCEEGTPEFPPVDDIHIGVITSSLGDHGSGDLCSPESNVDARPLDDRAMLIGSVRSGIVADQPYGFLTWDPGGGTTTPGVTDRAELAEAIADHVRSAGERGCGYEASLESWYRFLIDPEPVSAMTNDGNVSVRGAVNAELLAQRAAFLRPDSRVAIVMLTDENDCSILDEEGTQGWLVPFKGGVLVNNWRMPRATPACATDPNSPDCGPCVAGDPGCELPALSVQEDAMNLRCYKQKQRFGVDLLYPTSRYVEALTSLTIDPRYTGNRVPNPLFAGGQRDPSGVVLMGILGVPWQDLATDDALAGSSLAYRNSSELVADGRWEMILGEGLTPPTDPLMIESIDPRPPGKPHPILGDAGAIVPSDAGSAWNPINGHEQTVPSDRSDLQFACIFPLPTPVPCTAENEASCQCNPNESAKNSPICEYEAPETYGLQQYTMAYPSVRQLEVLRELGGLGITTSICPNDVFLEDILDQGPGQGYRPSMVGLVDHMKGWFGDLCLPDPLEVDDAGRLECRILEASFGSCDCSVPGRSPATAADVTAIVNRLENNSQCGTPTGNDCASVCACEVTQFEGDDLETCQNDLADPGTLNGFCYVDPAANAGNPALVARCRETQQQKIRFLGEDVPAPGKLAMIVCDPE
jgi:hypothetical protein